MKKLHRFVICRLEKQAIPTRALLIAASSLALVFCMLPSPIFGAPNGPCKVCHRRTQTITLGCNTLEYQRHLDHGDPMNACAGSGTSKEAPPEK